MSINYYLCPDCGKTLKRKMNKSQKLFLTKTGRYRSACKSSEKDVYCKEVKIKQINKLCTCRHKAMEHPFFEFGCGVNKCSCKWFVEKEKRR